MHSRMPPSQADYSRLRTAYAELSEDQKRRMCLVISKQDPDLFKVWFDWANCKGFTERSAANRPTGVGARLDHAILKSEVSETLLRSVIATFCVTEFPIWIDHVVDGIKGSTPQTVLTRLKEVLSRADAPFKTSEWSELFISRALLTPQIWLEVSNRADANTGAAQGRAQFQENASQLRVYLQILKEPLEALSAAKPIELKVVQEAIASAAGLGEQLRIQAGAIVGRPLEGDWQRLEDLEAKVEEALNNQVTDALAKERRARLASIAEALKAITRLNMKAASTRARADELRKAAVEEIELACSQQEPVPLPGNGAGREWLREVLALDHTAFDALISELNAAVLKSLGEFLSEVETWERLSFSEEPAAAPEPPPQEADAMPSPVTPLDPTVEESAPVPEYTAPSIESPASPSPTIELALPVEGVTPSRNVVSDSKSPMHGSKPPSDPVLSNEDLEAFSLYAEKEHWAVCAQYVRLLESKALPPADIFEILALLPHIREPASGIAEAIRRRLDQVDSPPDDIGVDELVIWSAALIPVCVLVSYTNAAAYLRALHWPEKLQALHQLSQSAIKISDSVPHLSVQLLRGAQPRVVWESQLREIAGAVEQLERDAKGQTILYQPATEVWKQLWKNGAFAEISKLLRLPNGSGDRRRVQELLNAITPGKAFDRLIQGVQAKHNPGAKARIEARAIPQFEGKSEPLRDAARRWLELTESVPQASNFVSDRVTEFKQRWASLTISIDRAISNDPSIAVYAKSAIHYSFKCMHALIDSANAISESEPEAVDIIAWEQLSIPGLKYGPNRELNGDVPRQLITLRSHAGKELNLFDSAATRITERDIHGAKIAIALLESSGDEAVGSLRAALDTITSGLRNDLESRLRKLRKQASNVRLSGIIGEGDASSLEAAFVALENSSRDDDNLEAVEREIEARSATLANETARGKEALLKMVLRDVPDEKDRDRLERLIAAEDVMTVHEYLTRLAAGDKLPKEDGKNLQPFAGFTPERQEQLGAALTSSGELDALRTAIRTGGAFAGISFRSWSQEARLRDCNWIETWLKIKGTVRAESERVEILLSSLGFNVQSVRTANRGALQMSEASVEPLTDRSLCPIPRFGSLSVGSIAIRHIWKWVDEETMVQAIGETAQQAQLQLVFFYGRLAPERRLALSRLCRAKRRSFLVVDELMVSHLCGLTEGRLAAFFRGTAPFTYSDPFVTASSLVPPEMFYGREEELAALMSSDNGRCFVYGGRQLGKTALLREAERRFANATVNNYAVWIDLLNHGIGREHGPKAIWNVILREFSRASGFERPAGSSRTDEEVPELIKAWLNQNKDRRILLLLDEADRFLEEDSREDFREARRLKGIMDDTTRRFKVVFAGLHNVQRTTQQANHPLAHLGDPINVGALSQSREWYAAFALASEPLTALGVRFSSADLVSRILTICNFYPGLIQQFCSRMWRRLVDRRVDGPPFLITEAELDEVYRDPELRQDIVGRFKLTLQLDPRYWHLAHIVALRFLEAPDAAEKGYAASELRNLATDWWQEGFAKSSPDEFRSLLDEMRDLGVLRLVGDRYSFRNANILLLLGSRSDVESELLSGPRKIVDYTPRSFRARRKKGDSFLRRPLTLSEESRLTKGANGVAFVIGSTALGLDEVGSSLAEISANENFYSLRGNVTTLALFEKELANIAATTRNVEGLNWIWVPAILKWNQEWVIAATDYCDRLRSDKRFIKVIFETNADQLWAQPETWAKRSNEDATRAWVLRKWTTDFLGPWLMEIGVPNSENDIEQVMNSTGGWPALAQELGRRFVQTTDWRKSVTSIRDNPCATREATEAMFVGNSEKARLSLGTLRNLRQSQLAGDAVLDAELGDHAGLLQVPATELRQILDVGEILGLLDRTDYKTRTWDPVFERLLLS